MSFSFSEPLRIRSNLIYKKGRKRALTEREIADAKEIEKARARRRTLIEKDNIANTPANDEDERNHVAIFSQTAFSSER